MLPTPALFRICQFPRKTYIGTHAQRQTQIELNRVSRLLNNMWKFCLPYMYLQRRTSVVGRVSRQIQNSAKCKIIWDVNSATCIKQCVTPIYQWWFYIWIKPIKLVFTSCVLSAVSFPCCSRSFAITRRLQLVLYEIVGIFWCGKVYFSLVIPATTKKNTR